MIHFHSAFWNCFLNLGCVYWIRRKFVRFANSNHSTTSMILARKRNDMIIKRSKTLFQMEKDWNWKTYLQSPRKGHSGIIYRSSIPHLVQFYDTTNQVCLEKTLAQLFHFYKIKRRFDEAKILEDVFRRIEMTHAKNLYKNLFCPLLAKDWIWAFIWQLNM